MKPRADHHARARAVAARLSDEQVIALVGNWRPVKAPPLVEFVRHCLIVEKETGGLIPFEPWPAQEGALAVIERPRSWSSPRVVRSASPGSSWPPCSGRARSSANRLFPIARQSDEYAREAIRRLLILAGYDPNSDPANLRVLPESPLPAAWRAKIAGKTRRELRLANGSSYRALTATQPIARAWPPTGAWPMSSPSGPGRRVSSRPWSRAAAACMWSAPATAQTMPSPRSMRTPSPAAAPTGRSSSPRVPTHAATQGGIAVTSRRRPTRKPEVRLVFRATDSGGIEGANGFDDQAPWVRLRARGERRLALERRRRLAQRTRI